MGVEDVRRTPVGELDPVSRQGPGGQAPDGANLSGRRCSRARRPAARDGRGRLHVEAEADNVDAGNPHCRVACGTLGRDHPVAPEGGDENLPKSEVSVCPARANPSHEEVVEGHLPLIKY